MLGLENRSRILFRGAVAFSLTIRRRLKPIYKVKLLFFNILNFYSLNIPTTIQLINASVSFNPIFNKQQLERIKKVFIILIDIMGSSVFWYRICI